MKKRIIIAAVFTACLALCAAVWPQGETVNTRTAPNTCRKRPRADCRRGQIRNRNRFANRERKGCDSTAGASP